MDWINKIRTFAATIQLKSHVRHAYPAPVFVSGFTTPEQPNSNDRDIMFLDDSGIWRAWFLVRKSTFVGAGAGLFAARSFQSGSVLTKYIGKTTTSSATKNKWLRDTATQDYVLELKAVHGKPLWIIPSGSGMYAHILNDEEEPNCEFDAKTGVISTIYDIKKNEELTLNYGKEFKKNWKN